MERTAAGCRGILAAVAKTSARAAQLRESQTVMVMVVVSWGAVEAAELAPQLQSELSASTRSKVSNSTRSSSAQTHHINGHAAHRRDVRGKKRPTSTAVCGGLQTRARLAGRSVRGQGEGRKSGGRLRSGGGWPIRGNCEIIVMKIHKCIRAVHPNWAFDFVISVVSFGVRHSCAYATLAHPLPTWRNYRRTRTKVCEYRFLWFLPGSYCSTH